MYTIALTDAEVQALSGPITGQGGWQTLNRELLACLDGNTLAVSEELAEKAVRYESEYGWGGWQDRLRAIVEAIRRQRGD